MNSKQLDELKADYARLIVEGMDMNTLEQFAIEMVGENMKEWEEEDVKAEILDYYGEETLKDLMPVPTISELEATADDFGCGK